MTEKELEVYSGLYDITQENLKNAGEEIVFTKDAFLYSAKRDLRTINLFDLIGFDKSTFLQTLYIGFLFRIPEEKARTDWENIQVSSIEAYQQRAFDALFSSPGAFRNRVIVCNNIFGKPVIRINQGRMSNYWYVEKLYGYYSKLPVPIQKILKRLLKK